jgi:DNA replication protein DnaD
MPRPRTVNDNVNQFSSQAGGGAAQTFSFIRQTLRTRDRITKFFYFSAEKQTIMRLNKLLPIFLVISLLTALQSVSTANASGSMLEFIAAEIKVDGDIQRGIELNDGIIYAKPESEISIKIELENKYAPTEYEADTEIRDIEITSTIEEVDDGDDIDTTSESFDLSAGRKKILYQTLKVPLIVDQTRAYQLKIYAEGHLRNGTDENDEISYVLRIDKENHELRITEAVMNPQQIDCTEASALQITVLNTGASNEEDCQITATSPLFGTIIDQEFEMSNDVTDNDNEYKISKIVSSQKISNGRYPINVTVKYHDYRETATTLAILDVATCGQTSTQTQPVTDTQTTQTVQTTNQQTQNTQQTYQQQNQPSNQQQYDHYEYSTQVPTQQTYIPQNTDQNQQLTRITTNSQQNNPRSQTNNPQKDFATVTAGFFKTFFRSLFDMDEEDLPMYLFIFIDLMLLVLAAVIFMGLRRPKKPRKYDF